MTDIVPELNKAIETAFQSGMNGDRRVRSITKRIAEGKATLEDVHEYSVRVGENISKALTECITEDVLPNGTMYYNIADRTVRPALHTGYDLVNEAAAETQKAIDAANKIGANAVHAIFPEARVDSLLDKMTGEGEAYDALRWLYEPIVNNTQAFFDDFVRENARVSAKLGLRATIKRTASAGACEWCASMTGSYEYGEEPDDIYRRHRYCRCSVTFSRERGRYQDVHSKRWYNEDGNALNRRKTTLARGQKRDKIKEKKEELSLNLQFFAEEKALKKQSEGQLRRGIKSIEEKIRVHREYLGNPKSHVENWDSLSKERKDNYIAHWKTEINTFKQNIINRKEELRRRGINE